MATYPNDAAAPVTAFSVLTEVTYQNTGAATDFNLATRVDNRGEVLAFIDGVAQSTSAYDLSNAGASISFLNTPAATNLTIKTISIPARFVLSRTFPAVRNAEYNNTSPVLINSNAYIINANQQSFALPEGVAVTSTSEFMVFLSGVYQQESAYTYPSINLGYAGIDIGDNTATKLLLNYVNNTTDDSVNPKVVTNVGSVTFSNASGNYSSVYSGSNYLITPSSNDLNIHNKSFTLDTHFTTTLGASMASNQTLFARYQDADNYYILRTVGANSNVGFVVNRAGSTSELYGGNANGGVGYHVAVTHDVNNAELTLYVNNVKVSTSNYLDPSSASGPVLIGSGNTIAQGLTGSIAFTRFTDGVRYRGNGAEPVNLVSSFTTQQSAPLGMIDPTDSLSIRVFDAEVTVNDRFSSMADRKPDKGIASTRKSDTIIFESQAGYEKRRLRSRRSKREYDLSYTNITGIEKTAIENFYNARSGEYEAFTFDLSHINEAGTITTRFDGPLTVQQVLSNGPELVSNFYVVSFKLKETYD